jgi:hypothetical protein
MGLTDDPHSSCLHEKDERGMQQCYLVLSEAERAKGFVRAVRSEYVHAASLGGCGAVTWMALPLAQTYARDPHFYTGTWCGGCSAHHPVGENGEFYWWVDGRSTEEKVGT